MFNARVHDLIYQKSNIQYRLQKITKKLMDFQQYSALIGSGEVRPETLAALPGSMFGRALGYLSNANNSALAYANQTAPAINQMWIQQNPTQQNPQQQQMMSVFIMQQLYQQGRDKALQIETKLLKVEEEKLTQEKEKLETLAQSIEAELKAAKDARNKGIQDMAPKYTA
jgi:hypothetical protein